MVPYAPGITVNDETHGQFKTAVCVSPFFMLQEHYSSSDNIKKSSGKGSMLLKNYFIQEKEQKTHEYF